MLIALACIVVGAVGAIGVHSADAQEAPQASLMGEALFAGPDSPIPQGSFDVELNCEPGGDQGGTITFSASGVAVGPYPGTFTESGTVVVQPAVPGVSSGPLASLHADFTIVSGDTVIRGFKDLRDIPIAEGRNEGSCADFGAEHNASFVSAVSYQATIETPTGSFRDRGTGRVDAQDVREDDLPEDGRFSQFQEYFAMSSGVVPLCEEVDEDDDGLSDGREFAFGTSLGDADSDDDGVADGDDDADGDEEDDEDEDDEEDPCPADSDHDGEDDEDEDD